MSQHDAGEDASGSLVSARWLLKPLRPSVMKTQEPKLNVMPSSSTALVKLNDAISSPVDHRCAPHYLACQLSVFNFQSHRGIPPRW
jgi:hypothetical protein